jgi:sugar phosphate isomerase/epimerase
MGNIKAINIRDTFRKTTDEAIKKALELVKAEKASIIVMGKRGRPTKYSPKLCELLPAMFANGESVAEVCAELGIVKDTFYNWIDQYKDFSNSYKKGLELSLAWWSKIGRLGSIGKVKINPATWIFNMKNRHGWADRVEQAGNSNNTNVNLDVANMTPEQRKQLIDNFIQKADVQS